MGRARQLIELIDPDINVDRFGSRVDITRVETFDYTKPDVAIEEIKNGIQAPFVNAYKSTLGGIQNTSIMINVSLDPKESWNNGIYQNSRYFQARYDVSGVLEIFSKQYSMPKFRKARAKNPAVSLYFCDIDLHRILP